MGNAAERAREGQDAEVAFRRRRKTRQNFGDVDEFVERVDDNNASPFDESTHDAMIAGQRAGVRARRLFGLGAAAGMHHHDGFAAPERLSGDVDELLRTPDVLRIERDDLHHRIVEEIPDEVGKA